MNDKNWLIFIDVWFCVLINGNKCFKCERCDFVTYAMGFLDKHIAMVHRKEKPFKCPEPECGYGATSVSVL